MKKLLLFLTACIAAFGMSACGKNQPAQTTLPPAGAAGSAVTETAQPEETEPDDTVRLTVWVNQSETEITEEMTEAFRQAFPDAAFEITVEGVEQDSCREKVMDSLMDAADLFWISDRDLQAMAEEKALQPVVMSPETIRKRNFDGASEAATGQDGTMYAYPASGSGDPVLYYNSGIFTEEDVQSLEAMCSKAAEGDSRIGWSLGFDDGTLLYSFFAGAGLRVEASEDGKGNLCDWDCPDGEAVCRFLLLSPHARSPFVDEVVAAAHLAEHRCVCLAERYVVDLAILALNLEQRVAHKHAHLGEVDLLEDGVVAEVHALHDVGAVGEHALPVGAERNAAVGDCRCDDGEGWRLAVGLKLVLNAFEQDAVAALSVEHEGAD